MFDQPLTFDWCFYGALTATIRRASRFYRRPLFTDPAAMEIRAFSPPRENTTRALALEQQSCTSKPDWLNSESQNS
jgi:hypothetical protein